MSNLADTLMRIKDYAGAESLLQQALGIQRRVLGPNHPNTARSTYSMGSIEARLGTGGSAFPAERVSRPRSTGMGREGHCNRTSAILAR
jgi:hypothetical protein